MIPCPLDILPLKIPSPEALSELLASLARDTANAGLIRSVAKDVKDVPISTRSDPFPQLRQIGASLRTLAQSKPLLEGASMTPLDRSLAAIKLNDKKSFNASLASDVNQIAAFIQNRSATVSAIIQRAEADLRKSGAENSAAIEMVAKNVASQTASEIAALEGVTSEALDKVIALTTMWASDGSALEREMGLDAGTITAHSSGLALDKGYLSGCALYSKGAGLESLEKALQFAFTQYGLHKSARISTEKSRLDALAYVDSEIRSFASESLSPTKINDLVKSLEAARGKLEAARKASSDAPLNKDEANEVRKMKNVNSTLAEALGQPGINLYEGAVHDLGAAAATGLEEQIEDLKLLIGQLEAGHKVVSAAKDLTGPGNDTPLSGANCLALSTKG